MPFGELAQAAGKVCKRCIADKRNVDGPSSNIAMTEFGRASVEELTCISGSPMNGLGLVAIKHRRAPAE